MKYEFTVEDLLYIYDQHILAGPRGAYKSWVQENDDPVATQNVEDFIVCFYSQYNAKIRQTF
jgi:hypothetical protein